MDVEELLADLNQKFSYKQPHILLTFFSFFTRIITVNFKLKIKEKNIFQPLLLSVNLE